MIEALEAEDSAIVLGLGLYGRAVVEALHSRSVTVTAIEDWVTPHAASFASDWGIELVTNPTEIALHELFASNPTAFVPSPGVPEHHPAFKAAEAAEVPVISEFDLARWWDDRPIAAITGTDGKTTVTMLTVAMLRESGLNAAAVGNTEVPLIRAIDDATIEVFVVEASSFRLGHTQQFAPRAAAWLNFGPDHLDVHRDLAVYEEAKAAIWRDLPEDGVAVMPIGDPVVERHLPSDRRVIKVDPALSPDGELQLEGQVICSIDDLPRQFAHDIENTLVAAALALELGANLDGVRTAIRNDTGLPHRIQYIRTIDGVAWYNDSKATVPHAVITAVNSFDRAVLIAGGRNKGLDLGELAVVADRLDAVIALGEAAGEIEAAFSGAVPVERATTMETAVTLARSLAKEPTVVLLSPGCASYDSYTSYGARGDDFIRCVEALEQGVPQ